MKNYLRAPAIERLARLSKPSDKSQCIEFTGYLNEDGYGRFYYEGKRELSHRAAYQIYCGPIPDDKQVLHECDNPRCVNHRHLFLGTSDDNMKDMVAKGRSYKGRGADHHNSKLNPVKAFEIRWYAAMGYKHALIAAMYDVTRPLISGVVRGESWPAECHD